MSSQSFNIKKEKALLEGFRIPHHQTVRSIGSRKTSGSDTNSIFFIK